MIIKISWSEEDIANPKENRSRIIIYEDEKELALPYYLKFALIPLLKSVGYAEETINQYLNVDEMDNFMENEAWKD